MKHTIIAFLISISAFAQIQEPVDTNVIKQALKSIEDNSEMFYAELLYIRPEGEFSMHIECPMILENELALSILDLGINLTYIKQYDIWVLNQFLPEISYNKEIIQGRTIFCNLYKNCLVEFDLDINKKLIFYIQF